ncbi:MAG: 1-deoxy-D-xylulose-5-phosphate synthase [Lachnospiraceae bacterium]|nr:1-deoxy-D-xylulose-5-phosphate synthase [Lachnospiraceae bacterium]
MLEKINKPNDVQKLSVEELPELAAEIRKFLIRSISKTGGHLGSNLGVVELTIALHRVYHLPEDKIIWDVGHQAYTHKILTGRKDDFEHLRMEGGISGFPRRAESACDSFDTGHSSTSISCGLGYVKARDLLKKKYSVVSIIGDGALTGGPAFEALNNLAELEKNYVVILNDNQMSINRNVGGMPRYLGTLRTSAAYTDLKMKVTNALQQVPKVGEEMVDTLRRTKSSIKQLVIPGMLFENMGLTYLGPVDGHNIPKLIQVLEEAKRFQGPVLVHVITQKGRGYAPAIRQPAKFHGTGPFVIKTGQPKKMTGPSYGHAFSEVLCEEAGKNKKITAVTAAMKEGTGLAKFAELYPDRFFDVGIAEGHAVTFASGLALGGLIPVFAVYSSFLQRGFDQLMHDICMQNLPSVFMVDRAGLVGADGRSHQGCFDLSYLSMMPNMTVMAPKNDLELKEMFRFAVRNSGPTAIRYPRGAAWTGLQEHRAPVERGRSELLFRGSRIALLAVGSMVETALQVREHFLKQGVELTLVNVRFVKPLDRELLRELAEDHSCFVTMEENVRIGGFGQQTADFVREEELPVSVSVFAIPDQFVGHGSVDRQRQLLGLDAGSVIRAAERLLKKERSYDSVRLQETTGES